MRWLRLPPVFLLIVGLVGCDSVEPVAPPGTVLTISANPSRIPSDGASEIRVTARKPNGTPLNEGTVISFGTTVGQIQPSVPVDARGEAVTMLRGDDQFGMATVTASAGGSEAATVDVQVGLPATSITLQATPTSVPETGGELELVALVRDDQGRPLAKAQVNFLTDTGTLDSGGLLRMTDSNGRAEDTLLIEAGDLDVLPGDTFQIEAAVGSGTGSVISDVRTISIQRLPVADFTFGTSNLTVVFTDTTRGRPNKWSWSFGDGNTSQRQNPSHTFAAAGTYVVTLTANNALGSDTVSKFVSVSGQ